MSCDACAEFQADPGRGHYFYRWKHANVEIVACPAHALEIMNALTAAQVAARVIAETTTPPPT